MENFEFQDISEWMVELTDQVNCCIFFYKYKTGTPRHLHSSTFFCFDVRRTFSWETYFLVKAGWVGLEADKMTMAVRRS